MSADMILRKLFCTPVAASDAASGRGVGGLLERVGPARRARLLCPYFMVQFQFYVSDHICLQ